LIDVNNAPHPPTPSPYKGEGELWNKYNPLIKYPLLNKERVASVACRVRFFIKYGDYF